MLVLCQVDREIRKKLLPVTLQNKLLAVFYVAKYIVFWTLFNTKIPRICINRMIIFTNVDLKKFHSITVIESIFNALIRQIKLILPEIHAAHCLNVFIF